MAAKKRNPKQSTRNRRARGNFKRCHYCNASVKTENWLAHLRRAHLSELTPEDKVYIYSLRTIKPLVEETLTALQSRDKADLTEFEQSVLFIHNYGTEDQHELLDWYFATKSALDGRVYNKDGLIEENAHYKLTDLIVATLEAVGFAKITGKHDPVMKEVLANYVENAIREGDVKTEIEKEEFFVFMEERIILKRLQQLLVEHTTHELFEAVDRFLADALVFPGNIKDQYIKTLHANPNHFGARYNLTKLLIEEGHLEDAETQLRECIKLRPTAHAASVDLATLLMDRGAYDEAVAVCEEAFEKEAEEAKTAEEEEDGDVEKRARKKDVDEHLNLKRLTEILEEAKGKVGATAGGNEE